jgi:orotate phosphoribosyltransferase
MHHLGETKRGKGGYDMAVRDFEDIERRIWEEEKRYLMKHISLSLIRGKALKIGDYTLSSGKKSPYYVDLRQSISDPIAMDWIANALARIVASEIGKGKVDKIMGVPTAGVPFATLVSQKLAIRMLYYRKERKEHGVRKKIEGDMERNDRIVMIDDLITTGQSVIEAAQAARDQGGIVSELVVLLDREQGGQENLRAHNIEPHLLFSISEAFDWLRDVELLSDHDYKIIKEYIDAERNSVITATKKEEQATVA